MHVHVICADGEATPGHFYWPDLDVDLGIETIEDPDRFPLVARFES